LTPGAQKAGPLGTAAVIRGGKLRSCMRTLIVSMLVGTLTITVGAQAQETDPSGPTLSESTGTDTPVVQMKNEAPPPAAPAAAAPAASAAAASPAGVPRSPAVGGAGMTYGRYGGAATDTDGQWRFRYNGYFRAPMNIGFGERVQPFVGQSKTTLSNLQVPGREFYSWQSTPNAQGPWTELFFGYGNGVVESKVAIQAFSLTDPTFTDSDAQGAQIGISQAFVSITPDISNIIDNTRFNLRVGAFWNQYGGAGKYDAGAYDTYIIGRTHVLGGTYRFDFDVDSNTFWFEHGFGVKQPSPSVSENTKYTMLHHAHAGINMDNTVLFGLHYMHSWTQEQDHQCNNDPTAGAPLGACPWKGNPLLEDPNDGRLDVYGADVRLRLDAWGEMFLGYSLIWASYASTVDAAIEVAHAGGGGFFTSGVTGVYLNERGDNAGTMQGNGHVHNVAFQYDFSLSTIIGPELFGTSTLDGSLFGMFNAVSSQDDPQANGVKKLKYGADLQFAPLSWFAIGFRADRLQPNNTIKEQSFTILSPRLVFRSDFASHEEVSLLFHHYIYAQRDCRTAQDLYCVQTANGPNFPDGYGAFAGVTQPIDTRGGPLDPRAQGLYMPPQENTLTLQATIWW
jgi:hypothetical protein